VTLQVLNVTRCDPVGQLEFAVIHLNPATGPNTLIHESCPSTPSASTYRDQDASGHSDEVDGVGDALGVMLGVILMVGVLLIVLVGLTLTVRVILKLMDDVTEMVEVVFAVDVTLIDADGDIHGNNTWYCGCNCDDPPPSPNSPNPPYPQHVTLPVDNRAQL